MENNFKVLILDDNPSFLLGYHEQILRHANSLELLWDCRLDVQAYSKTNAFFHAIDKDVDFLILDYRLGEGLKANILLHVLKKSGIEPNTLIISEEKPEWSCFAGMEKHISAILRKDSLVVPRSCILLEKHMFEGLKQ